MREYVLAVAIYALTLAFGIYSPTAYDEFSEELYEELVEADYIVIEGVGHGRWGEPQIMREGDDFFGLTLEELQFWPNGAVRALFYGTQWLFGDLHLFICSEVGLYVFTFHMHDFLADWEPLPRLVDDDRPLSFQIGNGRNFMELLGLDMDDYISGLNIMIEDIQVTISSFILLFSGPDGRVPNLAEVDHVAGFYGFDAPYLMVTDENPAATGNYHSLILGDSHLDHNIVINIPQPVRDLQIGRYANAYMPGRNYWVTTAVNHHLGDWHPDQPLVLYSYVFSGLWSGTSISFVDESGRRRHFGIGMDVAGFWRHGAFLFEYVDRTYIQPGNLRQSIDPRPDQIDFISGLLGDFIMGEVQHTTSDSWIVDYDLYFRFIYHDNQLDQALIYDLASGGFDITMLVESEDNATSDVVLVHSPHFNDTWIGVRDIEGTFLAINLDIE